MWGRGAWCGRGRDWGESARDVDGAVLDAGSVGRFRSVAVSCRAWLIGGSAAVAVSRFTELDPRKLYLSAEVDAGQRLTVV